MIWTRTINILLFPSCFSKYLSWCTVVIIYTRQIRVTLDKLNNLISWIHFRAVNNKFTLLFYWYFRNFIITSYFCSRSKVAAIYLAFILTHRWHTLLDKFLSIDQRDFECYYFHVKTYNSPHQTMKNSPRLYFKTSVIASIYSIRVIHLFK